MIRRDIELIDDGGGGGGGGGGGTYIPSVSITTASLPTGNVGSGYHQYLNATDGYPPYVWSVSSGNLPNGLTIDPSGTISGTPTTAGTFTFTISVLDAANNSASKQLSIQINEVLPPTITTTSLPSVLINVIYNSTLAATGGTTPYTNWQIIFGVLPNGLTLNSTTGVISGIPTSSGNYLFTAQVTDSNLLTDIQSLNIVVRTPSPAIITTSLLDGITGNSYSTVLNATGGTPPYVQWEILSGELPQGLVLSINAGNGTITGIPSAVGNYSFTIKVTDSLSAFDTQVFNLNIYDGQFPIISTINLPDGKTGDLYNHTLVGAGGSMPYIWDLFSGELPVGLILNKLTGVISGTPGKNGSYIFTVEITDKNGNTDTQILSITIGNFLTPFIITESLPNTILNKNYYKYVQVIGGKAPYTWSLNGSLPTGLILDTNTGLISGISTNEGVYNFNLIVTDDSNQSNTKSFIIQVGDGISPTIINTVIDSAEKSVDYYQELTVLGGSPSYTWSIARGSLPVGISLSANGVLTGTPISIGIYSFTVLVTDFQSRTDIQFFTLIVKSTGYESRCCTCVFTNEIVDFNHNATGGTLTATGGTIINNKRWQAPSVEGFYNIDISVPSNNGILTVRNTVNVIQKLELLGTDTLTNLLSEDNFSIETNYSSDKVSWEVLGSDKSKIIPTSLNNFYVNTHAADNCFGSADVIIRGSLLRTDICNLTSFVDVHIKINPIYPTPNNCGPAINKWSRESSDFRVITTEFEGGCDETHIRNTVPIIKWNVTYNGLSNFVDDADEICAMCQSPCATSNCCDKKVITDNNKQNDYIDCPAKLKTSNRLDDFWNLVYGQYKRFTLIDYDTKEVWYNVRFADKMSVDHTHRRNSTSRNSQLIWKPCCNKAPSGGTCSRHGIINYKNSYFDVSDVLTVISSAPTNGIVNDIQNSFGFTIPLGSLLSDLEYTVDGGTSISDVLSNPIYIGNNNYAVNKVGVRMKATSTRRASDWLFNLEPFTFIDKNDIIVPNGLITAPTNNESVSGTYTFRANATDLSGVLSVEFFIDSVSKGVDTTYPYYITLDTSSLSIGNHTIYAKITDASVNANVFTTLSTNFAVSAVVATTPAPPTNPVTDDVNDTFRFIPSVGIPVAEHEYSINGGLYQNVTSNPISIGNIVIPIGGLTVRVKAATNRNASLPLYNTVAFTSSIITNYLIDENNNILVDEFDNQLTTF